MQTAEILEYPSSREILAAKASEILAECIRVSDTMPEGHELSVWFLNGNNLTVNYVIKGDFSAHEMRTRRAYLDWSNGSGSLDSMLEWVRSMDCGVSV